MKPLKRITTADTVDQLARFEGVCAAAAFAVISDFHSTDRESRVDPLFDFSEELNDTVPAGFGCCYHGDLLRITVKWSRYTTRNTLDLD